MHGWVCVLCLCRVKSRVHQIILLDFVDKIYRNFNLWPGWPYGYSTFVLSVLLFADFSCLSQTSSLLSWKLFLQPFYRPAFSSDLPGPVFSYPCPYFRDFLPWCLCCLWFKAPETKIWVRSTFLDIGVCCQLQESIYVLWWMMHKFGVFYITKLIFSIIFTNIRVL